MIIARRFETLLNQISRTSGISTDLLSRWTVIVSATFTLITAGAGIFLHPLFFVGTVGGASSTAVAVLLRNQLTSSRKRRTNATPSRITDAQVFALLDSRSKNVTPSRLASATSSTLDAATLKLRSMAAIGTLEVDTAASETELVFVSPHDRSIS